MKFNESYLFNLILLIWICIAAGVFTSLFFVTAPYGRHKKQGWGIMISSRTAWTIMETPSPLLMLALFLLGKVNIANLIFLLMWEAHYIHRAFIFPFRRRQSASSFPVLILAFGLIFNFVNAYINGRYIFHFAPEYDIRWLSDVRFIAGFLIFAAGMILNISSDSILIDLKKQNGNSYKIPQKGLFRLVSSPNYLGEIIEWSGWAIATWSLPGLAFALWTAANLVPRAMSNHQWYKKEFTDYPGSRKALIPFIF